LSNATVYASVVPRWVLTHEPPVSLVCSQIDFFMISTSVLDIYFIWIGRLGNPLSIETVCSLSVLIALICTSTLVRLGYSVFSLLSLSRLFSSAQSILYMPDCTFLLQCFRRGWQRQTFAFSSLFCIRSPTAHHIA
jgi:hypothetical protein